MGIPDIVEFGRDFSVMIRIQGPDPKGLKMRKHAFHHYISGKTTLSASGIILPSAFNVDPSAYQVSIDPMSLVLTVASIIEPFLSAKHKDHMSQVKPELISGAKIDVMIEGNPRATDSETLHWLPAELITLLDIPDSSVALQSLIGASSGSLEHGWEIGWSLASYNDGQPAYFDDTQNEIQRKASLGAKAKINELEYFKHINYACVGEDPGKGIARRDEIITHLKESKGGKIIKVALYETGQIDRMGCDSSRWYSNAYDL